jgi:hypothetical protein
MSIDTTPLGQLTARVMEDIGDNYGEEYTVRTAAVIVEVDSATQGRLLALCTDDRPWVLSALLGEAMDSVDASRDELRRRALEEDDEDDDR